ncbi:MAG: AgmX/PglI C-terminal domain-containing protein [Sandaracinaceae bacterium]
MASESTVPPPSGGGNLKYAAIGVGLLGAAAAVWFGMQSCEQPPPDPVATAMPDAGPPLDRGPTVDDDIYIPEPEPDAGPVVDAGGPRIRYVTRYVGGGGSWDCSGTLDQASASRALSANRLQFRNCYERRLKVNNQLEGDVTLQVRVGRDGAVTGVQTGGSLRDPQVLSCIRAIAQRIHFPNAQGGCAVAATTLHLTPQN